MRYLGALRGAGTLASEEQTFSRADYDFDVFATAPGQVSASGEIRTTPEGLRKVFGCPASSPLRRNGGVEERRISGSS
jgi:hypothetical protein